MANKRKGQLTVSGEWARHLRPVLRRAFWKQERQAGRALVESETERLAAPGARRPAVERDSRAHSR